MTLSPETNDIRRSNLAALRWDAAWIDPALRRMAETAALRAGLSVEAWMERAIRKSCGMPETRPVAQRVEEPPAPTQFFAAVLGDAKREGQRPPAAPQFREAVEPRFRQPAEQPSRQVARNAAQAAPPKPTARDDTPLALTHPLDFPPPRLRRLPAPPSPRQETRGASLFLAAGIAAVLAVVAVMVVRDPSLVRDRFLTASNDTPSPPASAPVIARSDSAPLRVLPPATERVAEIATLPPPVELAASNGAQEIIVPAAPPAAAMASVPTPSTQALPPLTAALPPQPAPTPAAAPRPVQMAALPTQGSGASSIATDAPQPTATSRTAIDEPSEATPAIPVTPTRPEPQAAKAAPAPIVAKAKPAATTPAPAETASAEKTTQVAMAPSVAAPAPTPAPASAPHQDGDGATIMADAKMAVDLGAKVKTGDHVAEYRLGILYALGKGVPRDYDTAAKLLHRSAQSGLAEAQYDYGVLSDKGLGVPRDSAEAARWYAKAAAQGHPPAALNLGYAYAEGLGVARNLPEAARWFRRAAEAGLINAQFNLAYMFEEGAGLNKSAVDAYAWYSVAAERGDEGAQQAATRIAAKMSPHELQLAKSRIKTVKRSIRVQN